LLLAVVFCFHAGFTGKHQGYRPTLYPFKVKPFPRKTTSIPTTTINAMGTKVRWFVSTVYGNHKFDNSSYKSLQVCDKSQVLSLDCGHDEDKFNVCKF
jgi:hypothetical protein